MFFERHFGQMGAGKDDFVIGSLSIYLIQRFNALHRLCAKRCMFSLFIGAGEGKNSFDKLARRSSSAVFIFMIYRLLGFCCSYFIVKNKILSILNLEYVKNYGIMSNNDEKR